MKNLAAILLLLLAFGTFGVAAQEAPGPTKQDVGYAFGLLMGQSLGGAGVEYDLDQIVVGLKESLTPGSAPRFTPDQAKQLLTTAFQAVKAKASQGKIDAEKAWLATHAKLEGVVTTASGLQYEALVRGSGPKPTANDVVKVDYVGTLTDGTEFDSSVSRGEPAVFPLGQVIPAWTEGLQLMGVGDKFRFTIPSNLAYGAEGAGEGLIPPYATLVFVVDLLSIEPPEAAPGAEAAPAQ